MEKKTQRVFEVKGRGSQGGDNSSGKQYQKRKVVSLSGKVHAMDRTARVLEMLWGNNNNRRQPLGFSKEEMGGKMLG